MDKFLEALESLLVDFECESNELKHDLDEFICSKGKRIRPRLAYLTVLANGENITPSQMELVASGELLHSASLIHDDIIDDAEERRGLPSLHTKYDSKLAVIAGDLLASSAMDKVLGLGNIDLYKLFLNTFKAMCNAEIVQYFSKGSVPDLGIYLEKTKNKTALLFGAILRGVAILGESLDPDKMYELGVSFGVAFQIRNDINSFVLENSNDRNNGVYTAPDIYMSMGDSRELAIEKSEVLIDNEKQRMVNILECLPENVYKASLKEMIEGL